jgi:hypothetical protein
MSFRGIYKCQYATFSLSPASLLPAQSLVANLPWPYNWVLVLPHRKSIRGPENAQMKAYLIIYHVKVIALDSRGLPGIQIHLALRTD